MSHWNEATHAHEPSILTIEQDFTFDALGFVVLPQVLSPAELSACRDDELGDLCSEGGAVGRYVRELCGDGFRQDGQARHVSADAAGEHDEASLPLEGGVDTLERAYVNLTGWNGRNADGAQLQRVGGAWEEIHIRQCQGLVVAIALTDSADGKCPLVVVPSTHKSGLPAPPLPSSSPVAERPALAAGDVLLCAASTLHGVCPQGDGGELLVVDFISRTARPQLPPDQQDTPPLPAWAEELGEAEQTVLAGSDSHSLLLSDGTATWFSAADNADAAQRASSALEFEHRDEDAERWAFDTHGYLLLEGVMDDDWVDAAVAGIDTNLDRMVYRGVGDKLDGDVTLADIPGAPTISGTGRPDLKDLFQLPAPHNEPFLKMLAHPAIIQRLNWMIGAGYKVSQNTALCHVKGSSGQMLHAGNANPTSIGKLYEMVNGRAHTKSSINIAWQLTDVGPDDGGFVIVPGSHKSCYPMPQSVRVCNERAPIRHVQMRRGSVLFFLGGAVCHGAYRWEAESP
ncbi:MAG: phytanoyl-CoA dioxygenase family protein, partial [Candidatus Latescibacteria bacterium]|nr:phytanoyl-CoA dioxygenase family protein [Candidatus Latescibacterota bacterium]